MPTIKMQIIHTTHHGAILYTYARRGFRYCQGSVYGGASAVMTSSETTEELYPVEVAIEVMHKVALAVEKSMIETV